MNVRHLLIALSLWMLAGITRFWIAPQLTRLPTDYAAEMHLTLTSRARQSPAGKWETMPMVGRRVDQTLFTSGTTAIVQANVDWTNEAGEALFQSAGMYGVDRHSRINLPGYGNMNRSGQFLFPIHVRRTTYAFWDPMYIGLRTATFERTATVNGLPIYVFNFTAHDLDETSGYTHVPGVPERYQVHTEGQGTLWIEPTSGIVVDYKDKGVSYFVDAATGKRIADLFIWSDQFTPQTKDDQTRLATEARRRTHALERWLPLGLLLGGFIALAAGLRRARPAPPPSSPANPALPGASS